MMIKRPWKIIMMFLTLLSLAKSHDIFGFVRIVNSPLLLKFPDLMKSH
jgi:hypothetical protein